MDEAVSISELLNQGSAKVRIDHIPTHSKHEKTARMILNSILEEQEAYFPCIAALVVFPIQIWAQQTRKRLGIDYSVIQGGTYFGISTAGRFENLRQTLEQTDNEIELVKEILARTSSDRKQSKEYEVMRQIHGTRGKPISKHLIKAHYRDAILNTCALYNVQFEAINSQMQQEESEEVFEEAYHNTDLLIRQVDSIYGMRNSISAGICYSESHDLIMRCIRSLNSYSMEGHIMADIAEKYAKRIPEYRIAEELGKSRSYVNSRYENAVEIMSYLLWGYSTREILAGSNKKNNT